VLNIELEVFMAGVVNGWEGLAARTARCGVPEPEQGELSTIDKEVLPPGTVTLFGSYDRQLVDLLMENLLSNPGHFSREERDTLVTGLETVRADILLSPLSLPCRQDAYMAVENLRELLILDQHFTTSEGGWDGLAEAERSTNPNWRAAQTAGNMIELFYNELERRLLDAACAGEKGAISRFGSLK
jgi:hypothetical protein